MKSSTLHITNGDSTTNYVKQLAIPGTIITWREMLCEGKTTSKVGSEEFWKTRFQFLNTAFQISKKVFIEKTLKEYRNLCNQKSSTEIVLWFEHDLFCQINMIAVLSWLKKNRKGRTISLVSSGDVEGSTTRLGLSELNSEQLMDHYHNRITLCQDDIDYADYIWQLYCSESPLRLETVAKFNPMTPFVYLQDAIETHIQRFPSTANGLNTIENFILQTAQTAPFKNTDTFVQELLRKETKYGYGDLQYQHEIMKLSTLFSSFNPIALNSTGKLLVANKANFYSQLNTGLEYLGGARKYSYLYDNPSRKLLKIAS